MERITEWEENRIKNYGFPWCDTKIFSKEFLYVCRILLYFAMFVVVFCCVASLILLRS